MSGYGTEKVPTTSLNLGFPRAFSDAYAEHGPPEQYEPDHIRGGLDNTIGHDTQALWHQQKMKDAHRMANAKVRSTIISGIRAFTAPNNRPDHQQPVLGQRRFANPSNGAYETHSTRQDQPGAPWTLTQGMSGAGMYGSTFRNTPKGYVEPPPVLVGGVTRTSAGQRFVYDRLQARINQLNAIAEAKQNFDAKMNVDVPYAGAQPTYKDSLTTGQDVELAQLLQSILFAVSSYQTALRSSLFTDVTKAFQLIVRMATTMESDDIANVLEIIQGTGSQDGILPMIANQTAVMESQGLGIDSESSASVSASSSFASVPREGVNVRFGRFADYLDVFSHIQEFFERVVIYLREMLKYVGRPLRDRVSASNGMLKSLQFAKYKMDSQSIARTADQPEEFIDNEHFRTRTDINAGPGFGGAFISPSREDSQHGAVGPRAGFSPSTQNPYAFSSGQYLQDTGVRPGGRQTAYFGESPMDAQALQAQQLARSQFQYMPVAQSEASSDTSSGVSQIPVVSDMPPIRAIQDPITGQPNIVVPAPNQQATEAPQARARNLPAPAPAEAKTYKESDVPTDYAELISFSKEVKTNYPTIKQVYNVARTPDEVKKARETLVKDMKAKGAIKA